MVPDVSTRPSRITAVTGPACLSMLSRASLSAAFAVLVGTGCSTPAAIEPDPSDAVVSQPTPAPAPPIAAVAPVREPAPPPAEPVRGKGQLELAKGVQSYEDGDYRSATRQFQAALELGLAGSGDRAMAHKYLAFVACTSRQERSCRDEFRKALAADPDFTLAPAEAGHPIWGPVFRSVKADVAAKGRAK